VTHRSRVRLVRLAFIGCVVVGMGCSSTTTVNTAVAAESEGEHQAFPASYEGELPCADCQGLFYHLDLFEDGVFFLRTTSLGHAVGAVSDSIGSWETDEVEGRIALFGGEQAPMLFRIVGRDTLRKLDENGNEIESSHNYDLRRKDGATLIEPRLTMRGMYRYMADAALFEECLSGRRFQVAQEADTIALERAYLEARQEPGEPLLVTLQGRIAERTAMEGDALVLTVVPERFFGVWPGETCGARRSVSELENIYWKLTRLGDKPAPAFEGRREPHLVFHSDNKRATGTGGCNQFSGSYDIEGPSIRFGMMATTRMACLESKDVDEALLASLETATSFRKMAHHLEFFNAEGSVVARFEARELQ